ncbi:B-cell linker protein-like isoform X2 [Zootermopsis nevadensis]|uniref:B-cell linker protein-like isoform X2 n=1 Tax=Zootermopsis nevadensis TaxID=136037 RepID=UPI000B8E8835|nr:B-cell linker protein-like isoform X2 [Zootermopsis nevadensis]
MFQTRCRSKQQVRCHLVVVFRTSVQFRSRCATPPYPALFAVSAEDLHNECDTRSSCDSFLFSVACVKCNEDRVPFLSFFFVGGKLMGKMSKHGHHSALQKIRAWTSEQVQKVLTDHGLGECCEAVRKREVDGDLFLTLTEGQLALWKRDLNLATRKKLTHFVQDVIAQPEKYVQTDSIIVTRGKEPAVSLPSDAIHNRKSDHVSCLSGKISPFSDSEPWDTDFSDDEDTSKASSVTVAEYCNSEVVKKPPIPARPPALASKPASTPSAPSKSCNLPKPPVPPESSCYGHVKLLVSSLTLPENGDQFDEEEYESVDGEVLNSDVNALAAKLKKSLEARAQSAPSARQPVPSTWHLPAFPQQTDELPEGHLNDGYDSDEYESIKENEKLTHLPPVDGAEYYLQPVQQHPDQSSGGAPPLPAKPWSKPPDASLPSAKPPSPPRRKSDDSPNSPGNSGDGVTGLIGEILRKLRSPAISSLQDSRERTPTPEVKKAATLPTASHKLSPADQRPVTLQGSQRPLPPTPEDKKLLEKPGTARSRRTSKVGLSHQPWYHNVDRKQGEDMLRNGENGSFLVRPSSQPQNPLTLVLWYNRRLYNISIRYRADGRYALGSEKANELSFASVEELVQNYQSEKLVLFSAGEKTGRTLLTSSPPQSFQHSM